MSYLDEIRSRYPEIKAFSEDDDDWENEAYSLLNQKKFPDAQAVFERLILSQPEHQAGFEGLAYVCYYLKDQEKALWFMDKALELAEKFLEDDSIDQEVIDEMKMNRDNIAHGKPLQEWWNPCG